MTIKRKVIGFTLTELLVGASLFVLLMSSSLMVGVFLYKAKVKVTLQNELYNESRISLERIVREIRVNTIDYYEYFSKIQKGASDYGSNPGIYEMHFYSIPNDTQENNNINGGSFSWNQSDRSGDVNLGIFNTGADSSALNDDETLFTLNDFRQNELYLLSSDFLEKTILRLSEDHRIEMQKMILKDSTSDGDTTPDHWELHEDYSDFIPITPPNIYVENLDFYVIPLDDPRKSFAESVQIDGDGVKIYPHIQPNVTISFTARIVDEKASAFPGENNPIHLQTTVASRIYQNVVFPRPS